jgi:hypothetical protein
MDTHRVQEGTWAPGQEGVGKGVDLASTRREMDPHTL